MQQPEGTDDLRLTDVQAHSYVMSLRMGEVVEQLVALLGLSLVALIGGVNETRAVQQWMNGRSPQRESELRFALQLATMIATVRDAETARAWFQGSNPHLDDQVPAMLIRTQKLATLQHRMMDAARAFASRSGRSPGSDNKPDHNA